MSLITWNPNDKHNEIILTNNYFTATTETSMTGSFKYIRATDGRNFGKWYWEIILNQLLNNNSCSIAILRKDTSLVTVTSGALYLAISSTSTKISNGATELSSSTKVIKNGDILGFLLDIDNNLVNIYVNGEPLFINIKFQISEAVYPACGIFQNADKIPTIITANFGLTKFNIMESNKTEWYKLVSEGYLPYDIYNAYWFTPNLIKYNNSIITIKDNILYNISKYNLSSKNFFENNGLYLPLLEKEINKINYEMKYDRKLEEYSIYNQILNKSIIEKLRLNNNWLYEYFMSKCGVSWFKLNESNGNILDSKGSYTGTPYNLTYNGEEGISFNGTNSYIQFNNPVIPIGKKSIYFEIKKDSIPETGKHDFILDNEIQNNRNGFGITINPSGNLQVVWFKNNISVGIENYIISNINICDNIWHKVLYVQDENLNRYLYIDDMINPNVVNSNVFDEPVGNSNLSVGTYGTATTQTTSWFNGNLRNIQIYNDIIEFPRDLSLIKSNNKHYSFNKETNSLQNINITNPSKSDFETYGVNEVTINKDTLSILESNEFEVISLVEDIEEYNSNKIIEVETQLFKPIDLLNKEVEFDVLTYSEECNLVNKNIIGENINIDDGTLSKFIINDKILNVTAVGLI